MILRNLYNREKARRKWRARNGHNYTTMQNQFDQKLVSVGNGTYGSIYALFFNRDSRLKIGHYCSIGNNVKFIVSAEHRMDCISTYPFKVQMLGDEYEALSKGDIVIGDDVWIGENTVIMSGLSIGQRAVVAAGAVVTKDVEPYAIAWGVPIKVIGYRFSKDIIKRLTRVDFSKLDDEMIKRHIGELYTGLTSADDVENMNWLPLRDVR